MATARLDMKRTREILNLKWVKGLTHRQIARSLGVSAGVVGSTMSRAKHAGLTPTTLAELDDERLERRLYGVRAEQANRESLPAPSHIHNELKRPGGGATRDELFERLERPALKPLPTSRYELARWKKARVNIDYHIEHDKHYYSVPFRLLKEEVEVRATKRAIEVFHRGKRVATHRRGRPLAGHSTTPEHMPASHRAHMEWTPSRLISWGEKMGPYTRIMVEGILKDRPHPEMGYRSCLGILRLEKTYGAERLEAACERALRVGVRAYQPVKAILKAGLDRVNAADNETTTPVPQHENVRGADYYN